MLLMLLSEDHTLSSTNGGRALWDHGEKLVIRGISDGFRHVSLLLLGVMGETNGSLAHVKKS